MLSKCRRVESVVDGGWSPLEHLLPVDELLPEEGAGALQALLQHGRRYKYLLGLILRRTPLPGHQLLVALLANAARDTGSVP